MRHDVGVVPEHPELHLLRLVGLDRCNDGAHFAPVDWITIQGEPKLVRQVAGHRFEVILRNNCVNESLIDYLP